MPESTDISTSDPFLRAKLEALAEFAAGAGHEINNPVATIVGRAELLLKGEASPERRQALITIGAQALRIRDMIGDAMLFARPPKPEPKPLNLVDVVGEVVRKLDETARTKSLKCIQKGESPVPILADPVQLRVVISNLLLNSMTASAVSGMITVESSSQAADSRNWAVLVVHDRGVGLSALEREHLFDPFFSGRQAGRGLGFGLCKCWRIVERHGGRIDCESSSENGTTFRVTWPASGEVAGS
ncbi:MAG: ATP-binding region ATPase domain-containing protein [Planctomycetota bacterium]|nr:MAG: ATP-binding region ATPase domain-containing protein [Planctomycetota bacterium]